MTDMNCSDTTVIMPGTVIDKDSHAEYCVIHITPTGVDEKHQRALLSAMKGLWMDSRDEKSNPKLNTAISPCSLDKQYDALDRHKKNHIFFMVHKSLITTEIQGLVADLLSAKGDDIKEASDNLEQAIAEKRVNVSTDELFADDTNKEVINKVASFCKEWGVIAPICDEARDFYVADQVKEGVSEEKAKEEWNTYVIAYAKRILMFQIVKEDHNREVGQGVAREKISFLKGDSIFVSALNHKLDEMLFIDEDMQTNYSKMAHAFLKETGRRLVENPDLGKECIVLKGNTDQAMHGNPDNLSFGLVDALERKSGINMTMSKYKRKGNLLFLIDEDNRVREVKASDCTNKMSVNEKISVQKDVYWLNLMISKRYKLTISKDLSQIVLEGQEDSRGNKRILWKTGKNVSVKNCKEVLKENGVPYVEPECDGAFDKRAQKGFPIATHIEKLKGMQKTR